MPRGSGYRSQLLERGRGKKPKPKVKHNKPGRPPYPPGQKHKPMTLSLTPLSVRILQEAKNQGLTVTKSATVNRALLQFAKEWMPESLQRLRLGE